jgi:hypothetical protein
LSENTGKPAAPSRPILKDAGQARAAEREARRAAALRANLTRRKAQTRARDDASPAPDEPGSDPKA